MFHGRVFGPDFRDTFASLYSVGGDGFLHKFDGEFGPLSVVEHGGGRGWRWDSPRAHRTLIPRSAVSVEWRMAKSSERR
jgi:hypothetical protein